MTKQITDKDALWLSTSNPEMFIWNETKTEYIGDECAAKFLQYWRTGRIISAPIIKDESIKPVRVEVMNEHGQLCFDLPKNHIRSHGVPLLLHCAATYGGSFVYLLPSMTVVIVGNAPLYWNVFTWQISILPEEDYKILWPSEIQFDPAFIKS